ncbi:hypothetical protein KBC99_02845 [Candidatus Saccharibacteria bacterium]|nr:hypothetical protein [Candidatus Saccharibacteria bacterium]
MYTPSDLEYYKHRALVHVNEAVISLGGEPLGCLPLGQVESPTDCVVAMAFRAALPQPVMVTVDRMLFYDRGDATAVRDAWKEHLSWLNRRICAEKLTNDDRFYAVAVPPDLSIFISEFDAKSFPELIGPIQADGLSQHCEGALEGENQPVN